MTHASVFSGIGGPEVAATMLGWQNLFHCEKNHFGRQVLDYWYPEAESYEDITTTDFTKWRGRVDVLTGGFPCQPFSYAGQRRGQEDDRYLWPYMLRCIDQIRPTWVVAENVAGILTMVEQGEVSQMASARALFDEGDDVRGLYRLRETFTLQRICYNLESHGYSVQSVLIPACGVGAPHKRDRVFIIGHRVAADTDSERLQGRKEECGRERTDNETQRQRAFQREFEGQSSSGTTSDSSQSGLESVRRERQDAVYRPINAPHADGDRGCEMDDRMEPELTDEAEPVGNRWLNFPSVSPVHRGNDGFPFPVDNLSLPF